MHLSLLIKPILHVTDAAICILHLSLLIWPPHSSVVITNRASLADVNGDRKTEKRPEKIKRKPEPFNSSDCHRILETVKLGPIGPRDCYDPKSKKETPPREIQSALCNKISTIAVFVFLQRYEFVRIHTYQKWKLKSLLMFSGVSKGAHRGEELFLKWYVPGEFSRAFIGVAVQEGFSFFIECCEGKI